MERNCTGDFGKEQCMDKKNNVSMAVAMVLNCLCAVVWNIHVFIDFAYGFPNVLNIICAITWDICAVLWVVRFIRSKKGFRE